MVKRKNNNIFKFFITIIVIVGLIILMVNVTKNKELFYKKEALESINELKKSISNNDLNIIGEYNSNETNNQGATYDQSVILEKLDNIQNNLNNIGNDECTIINIDSNAILGNAIKTICCSYSESNANTIKPWRVNSDNTITCDVGDKNIHCGTGAVS